MRTVERNISLSKLREVYNKKKQEALAYQKEGKLTQYIRTLVEVNNLDELIFATLNRKIA